MIRFITEHKDHQTPGPDRTGLIWGVEPMCAVLTEHGIKISPSTYYEWIRKTPSAQQLRDETVTASIKAFRECNPLNKTLGSRKVWLKLRGDGMDVARCTVERLMQANGWEGARYGGPPKTTIQDEKAQRAPDLVDRVFSAPAPNRLWVADFTYCPTWAGMVYVAFVIDAFARLFLTSPLRTIDDVEYATMEWVDWYNNRRLHSQLEYVPPEEYEAAYCAHIQAGQPATPQP